MPIPAAHCGGGGTQTWQCTGLVWQIVASYGRSPALSKRIAIVEDEVAIRENYAAAFRREGYSVDLYDARRPAMDAFDARLPDLVVIDVNLKNEVEGGFELCRDLRSKAAELPIIFLTARDSEFDAVSGLRLGADDYLTKDISIPHLMARVAALFRRLEAMQKPQQKSSRMTRGDLELDVDRMTVRWKDRPVGLTLTEFWIVHSLARYPGHVRNRQQLMDAAQAVLDDNTITSHIKRIRRKFIAIDPGFDAVETVYGMGYRWLGD
jgi:two-component system OmpR family response regulator